MTIVRLPTSRYPGHGDELSISFHSDGSAIVTVYGENQQVAGVYLQPDMVRKLFGVLAVHVVLGKDRPGGL
jgi:hypothetical protein